MEPYKYYNTRDEEDIKNFFSQPKPLQRLAFIGMKTVPSSSFDCVVVTDDFALIERGNITPTRGLHGIFPGKRITFRWHYSNDSKKCKPVSAGVKYEIKRILSETDRYKFVEHVPSDCLCSSVLRDILYGKITNPHDAIVAYGKKLGVKHLNKYVFKLSDKLNLSPTVLVSVIDSAQLGSVINSVLPAEVCCNLIISRMDDDYAYQRLLRDMIEQAYALEEHINLMWSDKRLNEEHTKWSRELMKLTIGTKSEEPVWSESIAETFRQHGLELCNTEQRVFEEGYLMHHCVYTNYWHRIQRKEYIALSMQLEDGPVTIGLHKWNDTYEFDQAYHKFDKALSRYEKNRVMATITQLQVEQLLQAMAYKPKDEDNDKIITTPRRGRVRRAHYADNWMEFEEANRQLELQYEEEVQLPW